VWFIACDIAQPQQPQPLAATTRLPSCLLLLICPCAAHTGSPTFFVGLFCCSSPPDIRAVLRAARCRLVLLAVGTSETSETSAALLLFAGSYSHQHR
jgi:hypothetical protein